VAVQVVRVDFVSFLTQDLTRAKRFYTEVLGLAIESEGEHDIEFRVGQVTLDIFDPSSIGQSFAPSPAGLALRVRDGHPFEGSVRGHRHERGPRRQDWSG
jgi:catechol 2,3-dioxygenase-like lactoylglutathione lyase family enzyme